MANGPDNRLDDEDFGGGVEQGPPTDLSAFEDDQPIMVGSDDEALKKIRRRTSPFGRVVGVVLLLGVAVLAYFGYKTTVAHDARMAGVEACGQQEGEALITCLRDEFRAGDYPDVRVRIIRNLAHFNDEASIPLFVEALDQRGEVRREAAIALAQIGSPAADVSRQKLLDVLPNTDELDRAQVVWALAVLGESNAADAIIEQFISGRLQQMPGFDPGIITRVLGPARLSSDELLNNEQEPVRLLVAQALAEGGTAEVIDPLTRLVNYELARPEDEQSREVVRAAAAGLGRSGDPRAAQPLFNLLSTHPEMGEGILAAMGQSTGARDLAVLVAQATEVSVKRELVRLLAATHDPDAADTLAGLLTSDDEEIKHSAALALAELNDARSLDTLIAMAGGEDDGASDAALKAVRHLRSAAAAPGLLALLPDHCPPEPEPDMPGGCFRQASVLRALGSTGTPAAARRIENALDGSDSPAAAQSLGLMQYEPAFAALLRLVERPSDIEMGASNAAERSLTNEDLLRNRKGAILAMGNYRNVAAAPALVTVVEDDSDDYELRAIAAQSLGRVADAAVLQEVITKVQDPGVPEHVRRYYVQALWQKAQPDLNTALLNLVATASEASIRRAAAIALGYAADPANDARLIEMLAAEDSRKAAMFAIALGGSEAAATALIAALEDDADAKEIFQFAVMGDDNDWFNVLTTEMFDNGAIWRRVKASAVLMEGGYGFTWLKTVSVLRSGWDGPNGVNPPFIRTKLWEALTGNDATTRRLAAQILTSLEERGLLLKARDAGGNGAVEAQNELLRRNQQAAAD